MKENKQTCKLKNYCKICKKTIVGSSYKFKAHLYLHNAVKPRFNCKYCVKSFFRSDLYSRHLKTHENRQKTLKNAFICDYCDRSYVDKRNLISHLKIHDDTVRTNLKFTCKACNANYCEKRILLNHIRRVHFNHNDSNEPLHVTREINESWYENVVKTDIYVKITKLTNNLLCIKKHGKIKTESKDQETDKTVFKNKITEKDSQRVQDKTVLRTDNYTLYSKAICDYCKKVMLKKSIQNHIRERHLNIRKFNCKQCKQSFHRRYQLSDHLCKGLKRLSKIVLKRSEKQLV